MINKLETMMLDQTLPLDYPSILKQRIAAGEITVHDAYVWLLGYGMKPSAAMEAMEDA
jgi:hypothetical protein